MKKQILTFFALGLLLLLSLSFVSALAVETVSVSPKEIAPGETAKISINLENNLEEDVTDISVSLLFKESVKDSFGNVVSVNEVPFAPFDSSNEITIDELKSDKDRILEFKVIALNNAESGIYRIPMEIVYYDEDGNKHERISLISLTVNSAPVLDVGVEDGLLLKGQNNDAVIKVINKGLSGIKFLEVEIGSSTKYSLLSPKKTYLGDVDSDDFETLDFKIFFKENTPSTVSLPVSLTYRDITNKEYTKEFSVDLKIYSREQALQLGLIKQSYTTVYIIAIAIAIVLYIVYRKLKKRRQRKKAEASAK